MHVYTGFFRNCWGKRYTITDTSEVIFFRIVLPVDSFRWYVHWFSNLEINHFSCYWHPEEFRSTHHFIDWLYSLHYENKISSSTVQNIYIFIYLFINWQKQFSYLPISMVKRTDSEKGLELLTLLSIPVAITRPCHNTKVNGSRQYILESLGKGLREVVKIYFLLFLLAFKERLFQVLQALL